MFHLPLALMWIACTSGPNDGRTDDPPADTDTDPIGPTDPAAEPLCQVSVECWGAILDDPKTPCSMQIVGGDGAVVYDGSAGFELRGRSSLYFPKKQYALELREHHELPVWPNSSWRYLDDGTDPGPGWMEPGFDDSAWAEGPGPLGHGQDWLQTTVKAGEVTTYYRKEFTVGSLAEITQLELGLVRDDGAIVYLNGREVLRDNLPDVVRHDTPALAPVTPDADGFTWVQVDLDAAELLVDGTNVLAVELHQAEGDLDDQRFDIYLEASGEDRPTDLFGMGAEEDWILNGQYVDRSLFRNRLAYDLFQSFGGPERYAPETRFCELSLDGEYLGIYTLGERIERDDERVDIGGGAFPGDSFIVKNDDEAGFHPNAVGYGEWQLVHPDGDETAHDEVSAWLAGFEQAVLGDPADPATGVLAYLDLGSAVDWVILQELTKNNDAYLLSIHLWKDEGPDAKAFFTPWDLDLSMGYPYTDCGAEGWVPRTWWDPVAEQPVDVPFIQALAEVPEFREALATRWRELREGVLSEEAILERIAGYDATLAPAIDANFERWPIEDIVFSTPSVDNWLCPVSSYEEEHARTVQFLRDRLAWMDANIENF